MATKVINSLTFGDTYVFTTPYATCSTAAGTAAKVATITPGSAFSLETGVRVSVKFTNALSVAAPTLNVNSSGAKAIYFRGSTLSSAQYWAAGSTVDFVYDGTYWQMLGSQHNSTYSLSSFGITASATELNYTDGVTSNIQTQLNARTVKRTSDGTSYLQLGTYYAGGSTAKYVKISFPAVPSWTMVTLELTIRENYSSRYSGKLIIYANQSNSTDWALSAFVDGTLTTAIKVYGSDNQHIYVEGLSSYGGLSLDRMLIGDSATSSDLTNMTLTGVTALPTTYQTATMYYGIHSGNIGSQSVNYANSAGAVAWGNVSSKPSYYDAKAIKGITRSGTTFTYTCMDGTTGTFTQQDNNTTYTFTNNAPTLAWGTTSTIGTVGGTALTVKMPSNPNSDTYGRSGNTASKIYLMGTLEQSTSNKTSYSNVSCYASGGYLYSGGTKVSVEGHTHTFTDTNTAHAHTAGDGISLSGSGGTTGTTTISLAASGVTSGSYGPSSNASPAHSGTFSVPYITVDTYGRITAASTKTITLPSDNNTIYSYPNLMGCSCTTAALTAAKTATLSGFSSTYLKAGATVFVRFTYPHTGTTAATLNINSSGAKTIYRNGKTITSGNANSWSQYEVVKMVYDGGYWQYYDTELTWASF